MARPASSELIGSWGVPTLGNLRTLPAEQIPETGLYDSENMLTRDGVLQTRPGLVRLANSVQDRLTGIPTGAINYRDRHGHSWVVVGTTTAVWAFDGVEWRRLTGALGPTETAPGFTGFLTGTLDDRSRFALIELVDFDLADSSDPGPLLPHLLHTNGRDELLVWDGELPHMRVVPGLPVGPSTKPGQPIRPAKFTDLTTIGDHIVGLVPPYDVQWGRTAEIRYWDPLNFKTVAESPDEIIAIAPLGTLGGALYKSDSLWAVFAQGGSEATFFRFEYRGHFDGPACPSAVVDTNGMHFYMTPTGRIAAYNGSEHRWIADGLWPQLRTRIHPSFVRRIFGVYDKTYHEVYFFFPRREDTDGLCRGLVSISLPRPDVGRNDLGAFPGHLAPNARVSDPPAITFLRDDTPWPTDTLQVLSTANFPPAGKLTIAPYWHAIYTGKTDTAFTGVFHGDIAAPPEATGGGGTTLPRGSWVALRGAPVSAYQPLAVTTGTHYRLADRIPRVALFTQESASMVYKLGSDPSDCDANGIFPGEGKDAGEPFDFFWRPGLAPAPNRDLYRIDAIEPALERGPNRGSLTMRPVRSYALPNPAGEVGPPVPIDLTRQSVRPLEGVDIRGRFHGVLFEYTPPKPLRDGGPDAPIVRYHGSLVFGHRVE